MSTLWRFLICKLCQKLNLWTSLSCVVCLYLQHCSMFSRFKSRTDVYRSDCWNLRTAAAVGAASHLAPAWGHNLIKSATLRHKLQAHRGCRHCMHTSSVQWWPARGGGDRCSPGRRGDCGASTTDLINQNSRSPQKTHVCNAGAVETLQAEILSALIHNPGLAAPQ